MPQAISAVAYVPDRRRLRSAATQLLALLVVALAGCVSIDLRDVSRTASVAYATPAASRLGKAIYAEAAKHPGQSAFRVVESGRASLSARLALIDVAEHSVDLQYFLMAGDSADVVAAHLLGAADRGVRVRLLLDDRGQLGREGALVALSSHRNIEVRTFNPVLMRGPASALAVFEYAVRGLQLDRRMHNKLFIADNAFAMTGGRNIEGAYFEVSRELVIVSPYVIPDDPAMAAIGAACSRGARVVVLTNSLATNDMLLAHAGYASKRGALLDTCVELHELKAQALPFRGGGGSLKASSGSRTSLHVKALVLDRRYVFLTSLNLDPRSLHLNTEIGLWIDSPPIADAILRRVDEAIAPSNSYRVVRDERGSIAWVTQRDGVERRHDDEPDTTAAQRLRAKLAQLLPIEREL
jgi:phosphatidylserine/phosphatidylglycerophosphate/cardiolipin synthase-like enzyme